MKRILAIGTVVNGNVVLRVSTSYLVATGFYFPTVLQMLWEPTCGPWYSALSAVSKN